jgi:hypothetical protein
MKKLISYLLVVGLIFGFAHLGHAEIDLGKGLIAYYSFDDFQKNDATIPDESGNYYDIQWVFGKPEPIKGVSGNGIRFNGDGSLLASEAGVACDKYTLSFWYYHIKRNLIDWGSADDWAELVVQSANGLAVKIANSHGSIIEDKLAIYVKDQEGSWYSHETHADTLKEWTFVVVTFDGNQFTTYKNARNKVVFEHDWGPVEDNDYFIIGGFRDHNWFNGSVDEVRIYNRVLSDEEIFSLYQNPGGYTYSAMKKGITY